MTRARNRVAAVAWTLITVAACSIPGTDLPGFDLRFLDKLAHLTLFAVLAFLWLEALGTALPARYILVVVLGSLFGGLTEIYQGMLPWERTPDIFDAVANSVGLLAGSGVYAIRKRNSRSDRDNF